MNNTEKNIDKLYKVGLLSKDTHQALKQNYSDNSKDCNNFLKTNQLGKINIQNTMKKYIHIDGIITNNNQSEITEEQYKIIIDDILEVIEKHDCSFGGGVNHSSKE